MDFERDIGLDVRATDSVTASLHALAVGMLLLFAIFAVLDWCHFLPVVVQ
jgi:hypothetical protein